MVQWGILLMVVAMKINRKNSCAPHPWGLCPPSVGVCYGEYQEIQVQIGTECPGVHDVFGY